jgi:hypothetical protein
VVHLYEPRSGRRQLTSYRVYRKVWTSLHAQAWSDMSFFSVRGRWGDTWERQPYPDKRVFVPLVALVLAGGLVPTALALAGLAATLRRRALWPLAAFGAAALAAYLWWVAGQDEWAVKAKYLLFLVPLYALYAALGLRAARARLPRPAGLALVAAFAGALLLGEAWIWMFALG